jgi:alpha-N-acetylglucosamine transferase
MLAALHRRSIAAVAVAAFISICLLLSLGAPSLNLPRLSVGLKKDPPPPTQTITPDADYWKGKLEDSHPVYEFPPKKEEIEEPEKPAEEPATEEPAKGDASAEKEAEKKPEASEKEPEKKGEQLAFATFLSGTLDHDEDLDHDNYFIATRLLCWQLLHSPRTKIRNPNIDVVVMVTPSVSASRIARLKKDGATVLPVAALHAEWLKKTQHEKRWDELMAKLRAWQLTQYSRLLLLDGDIILQKPLDDIFADPGAQITKSLDPKSVKNKNAVPKDAPPLPEHYLLGGLGETHNHIHPYPPTWDDGLQKRGYFNAGFFMLHPNNASFAYYNHILQTPDAFDPTYMEQNLLNMVHNWDGPLPWKEISVTWNIARVNDNDLDMGVVSAHDKWWKDPLSNSTRVRDLFHQQRWEMQGWYDAVDSIEEKR